MFVKSIHLYDDKVIIAFNYGAPTDDTDDDKKFKNKISEIPIDISECSDIKSTGTPSGIRTLDTLIKSFA